MCRAALGLANAFPGIVGLVGRFNATDLRDTTLATFFQLVDDLDQYTRDHLPDDQREGFKGVGVFSRSTGDFTLSNGSVIKFRPLEEAERKYKSLTLGFWGMDEASEVAEASALMLQGRLRQINTPCVGFLVSNPTGYDHWLYKWYVQHPKGYPLFRTNTLENVDNLPPGYIDELKRSYPPDHIRRYLMGEWGGIDAGAPVYPLFDDVRHVQPVEWFQRRPIQVGIDFGYNFPGVVWSQVDPLQERLRVLKAWGPTNLSAHKLAEGIKARNAAWFPHATFEYYAGHDGNAKHSSNESNQTNAEIFASYGLRPHVSWTIKERGFEVIRSLLEKKDDGQPGLLVDPGLPTLIEAFGGGYCYDPKKTDETVKKGPYPPLMDALRYIAVNTFTTAGTLPRLTPMPAFRGLPARTSVGRRRFANA